MMDKVEFIGLDVGQARTGFARGSLIARLAEPLETIPTEQALDRLTALIKELNAAGVVVGLPRNLKGEDTPQTDWVRSWVAGIKQKIEVPFYAQDEALTSKIAEERKQAGKALHDVDALAAAIILQDFLDVAESERVVW